MADYIFQDTPQDPTEKTKALENAVNSGNATWHCVIEHEGSLYGNTL